MSSLWNYGSMPTAERHHLSGEEKLQFHNAKVVKSDDVCALMHTWLSRSLTITVPLALEPWFDVGVVCFNAVWLSRTLIEYSLTSKKGAMHGSLRGVPVSNSRVLRNMQMEYKVEYVEVKSYVWVVWIREKGILVYASVYSVLMPCTYLGGVYRTDLFSSLRTIQRTRWCLRLSSSQPSLP